jgi:hypothetical protein
MRRVSSRIIRLTFIGDIAYRAQCLVPYRLPLHDRSFLIARLGTASRIGRSLGAVSWPNLAFNTDAPSAWLLAARESVHHRVILRHVRRAG